MAAPNEPDAQVTDLQDGIRVVFDCIERRVEEPVAFRHSLRERVEPRPATWRQVDGQGIRARSPHG